MKTLIAVFALALSAHAQLPLGTATGRSVPCPSNSGAIKGSCYQLTVSSCPNPSYSPTVTLKVVSPAGHPKGTVLLSGTYGSAGFEYNHAFTYGTTIISGLQAAGFTSVETNFSGEFGWMSNGTPGGPVSGACTYGTVAQWIYQNIHLVGASAPLCATGVSGGSSAIAYLLSYYGFGSSASPVFFSLAELASGPPLGRIDLGCSGTAPPIYTSYCGLTASQTFEAGSQQSLLNTAFGNTGCSQHTLADEPEWYAGSNAGPSAVYDFPSTLLRALFGGIDAGVAPALGSYWLNQVTGSDGGCTTGCVRDAGHLMPNTLDAAEQILNDLTTYCKL